MRTKIAVTIQLLIHGDFNCAAVETGESRKTSRCSRPQPTITFSATESFHNQLRNPGSILPPPLGFLSKTRQSDFQD
jgi:hypothetical protein